MTDTPSLLSIGEFSARSRLSVRMLRHYDAHGVLVPCAVEASGYRRYSPAQLADAADVRRLRDVGFSVSAIAALLAVRGTDAYASALQLQRDQLTGDLRAARDRLDLIDRLIQGETMSDFPIHRVTVPASTVVSLRATVASYDREGELWDRMMPLLTAQGIQPIGPGGVFEYDNEYREADVDLGVFLPVAPGTTAQAPLEVIDLPAREVVQARVVGPYSQISEAHTQINAFIADAGLQFASSEPGGSPETRVFNTYLTDPSCTAQEDNITEVNEPVR